MPRKTRNAAVFRGGDFIGTKILKLTCIFYILPLRQKFYPSLVRETPLADDIYTGDDDTTGGTMPFLKLR